MFEDNIYPLAPECKRQTSYVKHVYIKNDPPLTHMIHGPINNKVPKFIVLRQVKNNK